MEPIQSKVLPSHDDALMAVYEPIVKAFAMVLGIYYFLILGAHLAVLKGDLALIMASLAAGSSLIILFVRFTYLRGRASLVGLEVTVFGVSLLALMNVTAHTYLAHDPSQFVYLLMFAFGVSMICPTQRVVGAILLPIAGIAIFLTINGPPSAYINNVFTTITAVGGGFAAAVFLHRSVRELVATRALSENLLAKVEIEAQRSKGLAQDAEVANFAKADFLSNMSHELRTPLNGVVGIAHSLAATDLSPKQREMVDLIENSGQMLTRLLSDILDFSKIEAGKIDIEKTPFNLREEISATAYLLRSRSEEKGLTFDLTFGHRADGWLLGDVTRVKQIVANLTSNAVKFTQTGGVSIVIDYSSCSEILEISVTDTGIGFDEAAGKKLFQRFVQADTSITRRFGGTGLGLSICRGLVDAMGGSINWTSEASVGTTFTVRLPLESAEAPEPRSTTGILIHQNDDGPALRILAAEDHFTNRRVLAMILEPMGVELVMCENGALALEAFKTAKFDLVLMDMLMPMMDGVATTKAIRQFELETKTPSTPIIMLTANASREHRDGALAAGADLHVTKPFTPASLIGAIEEALSPNDDRSSSTGSETHNSAAL